ncbi:hypothetical protein D3C71_714710 [compost metagenome]
MALAYTPSPPASAPPRVAVTLTSPSPLTLTRLPNEACSAVVACASTTTAPTAAPAATVTPKPVARTVASELAATFSDEPSPFASPASPLPTVMIDAPSPTSAFTALLSLASTTTALSAAASPPAAPMPLAVTPPPCSALTPTLSKPASVLLAPTVAATVASRDTCAITAPAANAPAAAPVASTRALFWSDAETLRVPPWRLALMLPDTDAVVVWPRSFHATAAPRPTRPAAPATAFTVELGWLLPLPLRAVTAMLPALIVLPSIPAEVWPNRPL